MKQRISNIKRTYKLYKALAIFTFVVDGIGDLFTTEASYKPKKTTKKTQKERSTDVPSWAKGLRPGADENGKEFARRIMDEQYGPGNYGTGPKSEFNWLKKNADRR